MQVFGQVASLALTLAYPERLLRSTLTRPQVRPRSSGPAFTLRVGRTTAQGQGERQTLGHARLTRTTITRSSNVRRRADLAPRR